MQLPPPTKLLLQPQRNTVQVKCNMQIDPKRYPGIASGFALTYREGGIAGLTRGWAPTFIGAPTLNY